MRHWIMTRVTVAEDYALGRPELVTSVPGAPLPPLEELTEAKIAAELHRQVAVLAPHIFQRLKAELAEPTTSTTP
jgi:hypothetical protein